MNQPRIPNLLAPAGDWDCVRAAIENGADAIYFGLRSFNARARAQNFSSAELPALMEQLHRRGVKGYVTFNTLVFANEWEEAERELRAVIAAGVDAAIVQDIGICRLIRAISPDFPIHASTQMTVTSAAGVQFAQELGCHLVVLARECSIKEIERIQLAPQAGGAPPNQATLPLEVFVHGALCVAYSGQCLTSEALGGRSANRGECAQACRMPYELISDGKMVPLGEKRFLLSPQDLAGLEALPELVRAGVSSLKIEGRLKSPEYVASITRIYRQALDRLAETSSPPSVRGRFHDPAAENGTVDSAARRYEMEMTFSRGLSTGWMRGINNQTLVHARFAKKRGVFLGTVEKLEKEAAIVALEGPLRPGDGVMFERGIAEEDEVGGRVFELEPRGQQTAIRFDRERVDLRRVQPGARLWKTSDPKLEQQIQATYARSEPEYRRPLSIQVRGAFGQPLTIVVQDELGHAVELHSTMPLVEARDRPLTQEQLRLQFDRLGGTPFFLREIRSELSGDVILPAKELNRLRREAVDQLLQLRARPPRWTLHEPGGGRDIAPRCPTRGEPRTARRAVPTRPDETHSSAPSELIVLVRSFEQLDAALASGVETIYCEMEDPKKYREVVSRFRARQLDAAGNFPEGRAPASPWTPSRGGSSSGTRGARPSEIWVAPPRITKPGEEWILKLVRSAEADGYLVRNYDHLEYFAGSRRRGDFSLNVANHLAAEYFVERFGLERLTASYDLNIVQLQALLQSAPAQWFEVTIHQHMPMFHMEHCVFCAFLSNGTDYTNCGRPCDTHEVKLRDRVGAAHPLKADAGCRNTVFNALAQTGAEYVPKLQAAGLRKFRLEFLTESAGEVRETIDLYRKLLLGEIGGSELWQQLRVTRRLGITRGPVGEG